MAYITPVFLVQIFGVILMAWTWTLTQAVVSALILVAVADVSNRFPRMGALLLTLPIVSILAFVLTWTRNHDLQTVSRLAKETLVLVPLGLPFFLPLAFAERLGISFWLSLGAGIALAAATIGFWFAVGPRSV